MREDTRAHVESGHVDASGRGQAQAHQRIDDGKGLDRLRRVEVVAIELVGEVESGTDDGDAMHGAGAQRALRLHSRERGVDAVVDEDRRVGRQAPFAEQREPIGEVGRTCIEERARAQRAVAGHLERPLFEIGLRVAFLRQHVAHELEPLVCSRRRDARNKVVDARPQPGQRAGGTLDEIGDLPLGRARPPRKRFAF